MARSLHRVFTLRSANFGIKANLPGLCRPALCKEAAPQATAMSEESCPPLTRTDMWSKHAAFPYRDGEKSIFWQICAAGSVASTKKGLWAFSDSHLEPQRLAGSLLRGRRRLCKQGKLNTSSSSCSPSTRSPSADLKERPAAPVRSGDSGH